VGTTPRAGDDFAAQLRRLRLAASLTQEELAERAGLSSNAIGALERGERRRPYPHTVRAIADALAPGADERAALVGAANRGSGRIDTAGPLHTTGRLDTAGAAARPGTTNPAAQLTQLFGRDAELAELLALLRPGGSRLVTVTGPGGVGKTRVALAVTDARAAEFAGEAAWVELSSVHDAALLLPTVARAVGLRHGGGDGLLEALSVHLRDRPQLVVLDNVEHLLAAASQIGELVARCPELVVLATSRAPLRIRAEQDYPLTPLALPTTSDLADVAASSAARLFLDRARAVAPAFALTPDTAPAVAAICRRLDGLPLAIELAAAHARFLEPGTLLARLDQAVSYGRARDLPKRQSTMRATLDWSFDLLTSAEQTLLGELSVFAGGFCVDAVEAVATQGPDAFGALAGLVDQSLVVPAADASALHRLLEPVRQYAAVRLAGSPEAEHVAARHASYYQRLGEVARDGLRGPDQQHWLDRLHAEHGNLNAALQTLSDRIDPGAAGRLLADTWLYWALRGAVGEGLGWAQRLTAKPMTDALDPQDRAAALLALAGLRYATGDIAGTHESAAAAVADLQAVDDEGPRLREALVLLGSGAVFAGDLEAASGHLARVVRTGRESRDLWALAHALAARGQLLLRSGDVDAGRTVLAEAEQVARDLGSPFTLATVLNVHAAVFLMVDEQDAALDRLAEAAALSVALGSTWNLLVTVPTLALVASRRGLLDTAATLFSAAERTAAASSLAVSFPPYLDSAQRCLRELRSNLDDATFERAWNAGRDLRAGDIERHVSRIRSRSGPR
jgi:predicted ATPase/DNA-binding XRE family transcriptional regulator